MDVQIYFHSLTSIEQLDSFIPIEVIAVHAWKFARPLPLARC